MPKPDFAVVHQESLAAVRDVLAVKDWVVQYAKHGIEIAVHACPSCDVHMLRSTVLVPLPVERAHAHYKVRDSQSTLCRCQLTCALAVQHTPNWAKFTPDATFTEVEQVSEVAGILHVRYRVPVVSSRDVVLYEAQLCREEIDSITGQGATPSAAAVARSILHPLCPPRRGIVRARLLIAITLFYEVGDGTQIVSIQQCVPRGRPRLLPPPLPPVHRCDALQLSNCVSSCCAQCRSARQHSSGRGEQGACAREGATERVAARNG